MRFGIDFGTTRTAVALSDRGNYPIAGFETADGAALDYYPTVAAEKNGELFYGPAAVAFETDPDATLLRSFKRLLSEPRVAPGDLVRIGRRSISLLDLMTGFFAALHDDLVNNASLRIDEGPHEAIIATPANAHSAQRFLTLEAARRGGFEVLAMMNEPSAAGVEYAHRHQRTITSRRELVLVYDLGGGTFDASLVSMEEDTHDVLDSAGVARLGGDDFDRVLFDLALDLARIDAEKLSQRDVAALLEHCREQKERLHANSRKVTIDIGNFLEPASLTRLDLFDEFAITIRVDRYYEACTKLVSRTMEVLARVLPGDIDEEALDRIAGVYVVGGGSALPVVARALREWFGRRVHRSPYPSASTAIGLAIAFGEGVTVRERLSRNFGVFREAHDGTEVAFDAILERDAEVPLADESTELVRTYRPAHNIGHFRYIECGWLDERGAPAGDITPFAEVFFPFDAALRRNGGTLSTVAVERRKRVGPRIEERYSVDRAGIVSVTITDLDTGYRERHRIG